MSYADHCILATDRGYVLMVPLIVDEQSPLAFSVRVYEYSADCLGDDLVSVATAERESDARLIAQTLAHAHICPECDREPVPEH